jgi:hypothetical protein
MNKLSKYAHQNVKIAFTMPQAYTTYCLDIHAELFQCHKPEYLVWKFRMGGQIVTTFRNFA